MLRKLFFSKDPLNLHHLSWTKIGITICSVVAAVVTAGVCPPAALPAAKVILAVGAGVGLIGARDAIGNK